MRSNCMVEPIKQFLKYPTRTRIYMRGSWSEIFQLRFPHFYWLDKRNNKHYHFCADKFDMPFLKQLWFQGKIRRFFWHGK